MAPTSEVDKARATDGEPATGVEIGEAKGTKPLSTAGQPLIYRFSLHSHPFAEALGARLSSGSLADLQNADTERTRDALGKIREPGSKPEAADYFYFKAIFDCPETKYNPPPKPPLTASSGVFVDRQYPVKDLDFDSLGAYSVYNWEIFFHAPLTIAIQLSKNQRYEEAQRWFHYIFDPTDASEGPTPERFWKVKQFQTTDVALIEKILLNLATSEDRKLLDKTTACIDAWKKTPFRPHLIARYRTTAYMLKTVAAYLDNLIAWGDSLFRQETGESINEAMQVYVLAAGILGPKPQAVPKSGYVGPRTYAEIRSTLKDIGSVLVNLESTPLKGVRKPRSGAGSESLQTIASIGQTLYFCIPPNDKMLGYWDTVADRLFKIRNSLNIQGIFRQLPLFEPPIDPALLARAAASGLDVGAVISGLNQPLPLVRFQFFVQKAAEICQEVKSLGNSALSAMEKEDNEALALLRARHERSLLSLAEAVRYAQWQEAIKAREGLKQSLDNAVERYRYYERQLGKVDGDISIPDLDELEKERLMDRFKFAQDDPKLALRRIEVDIAKEAGGTGGGKIVSSFELSELQKLDAARDLQCKSAWMENIAGGLGLIPQFTLDAKPMGVGAGTGFGGVQLSRIMSAIASVLRIEADKNSYEANQAAKTGGYARRMQDWEFQSNAAAGEISQIFKQLRAAQIREAITEREWQNHQQQIKNAKEVEHFLNGKETTIGESMHRKAGTQAFYMWMKRELKGLYAQSFQFAFDIAKKAERALQHELGDPQLSFIQFNYLAGREGLLAGEKLWLDIKRMEMAYHDLNRREYELTRHVSLLQLDPIALVQLRTSGRCTLSLPEELFDLDGPGHYFRRIKTVAVSIPCVSGPYASVNCTLTLLKSRIRKSPALAGGYPRDGSEDPRFSDYFGSLQSIVTSSAQNDSGLFETNLRDERYLPFENSGVVSEWQLQLPANPSKNEPRQFDYDSIADVILHLRYTAREGGNVLKTGAMTNLTNQIKAAQSVGSVRLFSIRHEFPTEWARFKSVTSETRDLTLTLKEEHYPFWSKESLGKIARLQVFAKEKKDHPITVFRKPQAQGQKPQPMRTSLPGLVSVELTSELPKPTNEEFTLCFNDNSMADLWLVITWGST